MLFQSDVVSKLKSYCAATCGNQRTASWTKLMCAGSRLAVKNAITLNFGLPLLVPSAAMQNMSAARHESLKPRIPKRLLMHSPRDNEAFRFPVSVKGVVIRDGKVVLLRNDRDEWELPGGKLELSESPEACLCREIAEELQLHVEPQGILGSWVYGIMPGIHVLVVTYGCSERSRALPVLSDEHKELRWFPLAEVDDLNMPEGYKASIRAWSSRQRG